MGKQDGTRRLTSPLSADDGTAPILHMDMDAFFASVELLERPDLRGLPLIVAHDAPRSIVTTASYEARRYGITSAMPVSQAKRLCPRVVILPPRHGVYSRYSRLAMDVLREFTPLVQQVSVDEAYADVSGATRLFGRPGSIAQQIRQRVLECTGLTCSIGVAASKFVAKLASSRSKPDGLLIVPASGTRAFLAPMPVGDLPGVGASTRARLERIGLTRVADLAEVSEATLVRAVGPAAAARLRALAVGADSSPVVAEREERSIGHEHTFATDVDDEDALARQMLALAHHTAARARAAGFVGRTVSVKVRDGSFTTITRAATLGRATDTARTIADTAWKLFLGSPMRGRGIRLIGVRLEGLTPADQQQQALWSEDEQWRGADRAVDRITGRFGGDAVAPASLLRRDAQRHEERERSDGR